MLDMLALVFVLYTGFVALAIVLPIVFWHEQQTEPQGLHYLHTDTGIKLLFLNTLGFR